MTTDKEWLFDGKFARAIDAFVSDLNCNSFEEENYIKGFIFDIFYIVRRNMPDSVSNLIISECAISLFKFLEPEFDVYV
jgi:hypothetical protein